MSSGHYCDGCAQAYYKCVCNKPQEKVKEQTIKMNERIKELLLQATTLRGPFIEFKVDQEKFAELIVRECARIGELKEQGSADYDTDISVGWYMKQHFGVEE